MINMKRNIKATNKKEYMKEYQHIWYLENKTGKLQDSADRYSENKEHLLKLRHERYLRQREEESKKSYEKFRSLREEIIKLLGGKCVNPFNLLPHPDWCNNYACLQIDHVHGNGYIERKENKYPYKTLKVILEKVKNGSTDYQLLCANCNWIKRVEKKETNRKILFKETL